MNVSALALGLVISAVAVYLVRRLMVWRRGVDQPVLPVCWLWPPVYGALMYGIHGWAVPAVLLDGARALIALTFVLDLIYVYGYPRAGGPLRRWGSLLLVVPVALIAFRHRLPAERVVLAVPHHGRALMWTDGFWSPQTFYFIRTQQPEKRAAQAEDPNLGRPVFSPLTGTVSAVEGDRLVLTDGDLTLAIGPIMVGTARVGAGDRVFAYQPLGLVGEGGPVPGICIAVRGNRKAAFGEVLVGRVTAHEAAVWVPERNQYADNRAARRWQME